MESKKPKCYNLLNKDEADGYDILQSAFNRRYRSITFWQRDFLRYLDLIHEWVYQEDTRVWLRSLVVGIIWFDDFIIVNNRQLLILLCFSKSGINYRFIKVGYNARYELNCMAYQLVEGYFRGHIRFNRFEIREWTIRTQDDHIPRASIHIELPFGPPKELDEPESETDETRTESETDEPEPEPEAKQDQETEPEQVQDPDPAVPPVTPDAGPLATISSPEPQPRRKRKIILIPPLKEITEATLLKLPTIEDTEINFNPDFDNYSAFDVIEPNIEADFSDPQIDILNSEFVNEDLHMSLLDDDSYQLKYIDL